MSEFTSQETPQQAIAPDAKVTLHFAIKLEDGQVVDSNFEGNPATFIVGDGQLLDGFENSLLGMQAGDEAVIDILPEQGFGMANPNNMQRLPRSQFGDMALEPGLVVSFADAANGELPGVIAEFDENKVTVDFNHPLAGKKLKFEVKIIAVE
ncbi:FKBP-type peptidyl-prolyl cis-trans isomerase [Amphritea pacifica]|uniref:Peptidyl-prolyl cis-trans isomerase n=1 Tax=Amphritea pacifica TaxID=2811233 RepID=A0ABS2WBF6_9GAMM|nr:peptidylprolyl isomerase [Amphritea pacifica]MBN0989060.1 peptidylprolyl isomerase [Amphritea pacifica]MBN1008026.1 peptidylprolyl isomerase [Amphritea pacifica]